MKAPSANEARMTRLAHSGIDTATRIMEKRDALLAALYEADCLMGHDDQFTEWRKKHAALMANKKAE